nr:MAG TPA: hypothetical protein [Caudoviricetes sp.]
MKKENSIILIHWVLEEKTLVLIKLTMRTEDLMM